MYPQKENRRQFQRVRIPFEVHVRCWGDGFRGVVRVLGEGGMFIDTIHPSPNGSELDVVIDGTEPIRTRCVSRDQEPGLGMGVEFLRLARAERARIRELISRYA